MNIISPDRMKLFLEARPIDDPRIVVSGNFATPWELLGLVTDTVERMRLFALNPQPGWPLREGIVTETPLMGAGGRQGGDVEYLPMRLSLVPRLFRSARPPDVVLLHTSAPVDGRVSLGVEVNILPAAIEAVRARGGLVLAQINPRMPYTFGDGEIPIADVDAAIEVDQPLPSPSARTQSEVAEVIGDFVASMTGDGATLQTGIGQVPDAVLARLLNRRYLGVWSEMISDGIVTLERAGCLDPQRVIISTFLFGTSDLYEWAHANPRLRMQRTETTNDPAVIARQPSMISINTALQVDLYAQSNASYAKGQIYSGFGGQPDFVSGALHSPGGQAIMALPSWHQKSDSSTVVPLLSEPVCSFQHSAIVTEHGVAHIFGRSQRDQAHLITENAADPRAREFLREAAHQRGIGFHDTVR